MGAASKSQQHALQLFANCLLSTAIVSICCWLTNRRACSAFASRWS